MIKQQQSNSRQIKTWFWIILMLMIILVTGFYAFFMVSDKGHPYWDFRAIKDVPGQSPNATYERLPNPQHVKGKKGE